MKLLHCMLLVLVFSFFISSTRSINGTSGKESGKTIPSSKIIGGNEPSQYDWKWIVSVRTLRRPANHHGGGFLLASQWVVTSVHNILRFNNERGYLEGLIIPVIAPKYNNKLVYLDEAPKFYIDKWFCRGVNPMVEIKSDIAVLKLTTPIPLQRRPYYFKSARIQEWGDTINWNSRNFRVAGWGKQVEGPTPIEEWETLHHIKIKRAPCPRELEYIPGKTFCAGERFRTICEMDSGGPLMLKPEGQNEEIVVGLVTYGTEDCDTAGGYVNVSYHADWIRNIVNNEPATDQCEMKFPGMPIYASDH